MDPAALSLLLRGKRRIQASEAEHLAVKLNVPVADVLENIGVNPVAGSHNTALLVGTADDQGVVHMERPKTGARRVSAPTGLPENAAAIVIHLDGFADGWTVFFTRTDKVDAEGIGRLCVAQEAGATNWYLRVLKRGYVKGTWNLIDQWGRSGAIENVRLASAAPVLWIKTGV
jgi:hypothetical protein